LDHCIRPNKSTHHSSSFVREPYLIDFEISFHMIKPTNTPQVENINNVTNSSTTNPQLIKSSNENDSPTNIRFIIRNNNVVEIPHRTIPILMTKDFLPFEINFSLFDKFLSFKDFTSFNLFDLLGPLMSWRFFTHYSILIVIRSNPIPITISKIPIKGLTFLLDNPDFSLIINDIPMNRKNNIEMK
jgi:hypothetical protein